MYLPESRPGGTQQLALVYPHIYNTYSKHTLLPFIVPVMSARKLALHRGSSEGVTSDSAMQPYIKFSIENIEPYYLPPDLEDIARQPLPRYDFHTELELLRKYEEIRLADRDRVASSTPIVSADNIATSFTMPHPGADSRPTHQIDNESSAQSPEEFAIKRALVEELSKETKESEEVCEFYLESSEWDYAKAKDMMHEMKN